MAVFVSVVLILSPAAGCESRTEQDTFTGGAAGVPLTAGEPSIEPAVEGQAWGLGEAGPVDETGGPVTTPGLLPAIVTRVVDGDTVYVRLDDGSEEKVRLIGVDTPESTTQVEPYGKEAAAYTKGRLDGKKIYLELDVGERDKYGRLLAYVWLDPPGDGSEAEVRAEMFNAELLLAGMAQVMTVTPNVKYADLFGKLQREAREAEKGPNPGLTN